MRIYPCNPVHTDVSLLRSLLPWNRDPGYPIRHYISIACHIFSESLNVIDALGRLPDFYAIAYKFVDNIGINLPADVEFQMRSVVFLDKLAQFFVVRHI